jgi:hypothetical protein
LEENDIARARIVERALQIAARSDANSTTRSRMLPRVEEDPR